ncbi:MAG TPA: hypothetical protein ENI44_04870 [Thermoplasmatales archaeon]|nr:hypothetical protein [Thermoplasmatales archaeon]
MYWKNGEGRKKRILNAIIIVLVSLSIFAIPIGGYTRDYKSGEHNYYELSIIDFLFNWICFLFNDTGGDINNGDLIDNISINYPPSCDYSSTDDNSHGDSNNDSSDANASSDENNSSSNDVDDSNDNTDDSYDSSSGSSNENSGSDDNSSDESFDSNETSSGSDDDFSDGNGNSNDDSGFDNESSGSDNESNNEDNSSSSSNDSSNSNDVDDGDSNSGDNSSSDSESSDDDSSDDSSSDNENNDDTSYDNDTDSSIDDDYGDDNSSDSSNDSSDNSSIDTSESFDSNETSSGSDDDFSDGNGNSNDDSGFDNESSSFDNDSYSDSSDDASDDGNTTGCCNNTCDIPIIGEGRPDLVLYDVFVGGDRIYYRISNDGGKTAECSVTCLYINGEFVLERHENRMIPGQMNTIPFNYPINSIQGSIEITVVIDSEDSVNESNETNNILTIHYPETSNDGDIDLTIDSIFLSGNQINYRIQNLGTGRITSSNTYIYVNGQLVGVDQVGIMAGGQMNTEGLDYPWQSLREGDVIKIVADGPDDINEINESNNEGIYII